MQVSQNDLKTAFEHSDLPRLGYTFELAMSLHSLEVCLKHLAVKNQKQVMVSEPKQAAVIKPAPVMVSKPQPLPAPVEKDYWYNNY